MTRQEYLEICEDEARLVELISTSAFTRGTLSDSNYGLCLEDAATVRRGGFFNWNEFRGRFKE